MQPTMKASLVDVPIRPTLTRMTLQMMVGIMGMIAFNLVDTFFIGKLGTRELAAISFTFPVVMVIGGLSMGLSVGASSVISRAIGQGDQFTVQRLTTDILALAVLLVTGLVLVGLFTMGPVFRALGASEEVIPLIREYMLIWYPGMVFVVVPMVGNSAIRATGDAKWPSLIMMVAFGVNAILDPVLIFGLGPFPRLELAGAAIATVIARGSSLLLSLWLLHRLHMISFKPRPVRLLIDSWTRLLYVGGPNAATHVIVPLGAGLITRLVAGYGEASVAGFGVATRVDMLALAPLMALGAVLGPFVGQNWGAARLDRVRAAARDAQAFALLWGLFTLTMLFFLGRSVAGLFNDDPTVMDVADHYLSIVPLGYGLMGVLMLSNTCLNALNRPLHAATLTMTQILLLYVPLAHLGERLIGLTGIFSAAVAASAVAGIAAYLWLRRVLRGEPASAVVQPSP